MNTNTFSAVITLTVKADITVLEADESIKKLQKPDGVTLGTNSQGQGKIIVLIISGSQESIVEIFEDIRKLGLFVHLKLEMNAR